jgi:hypothetical protein
VLITFRDWHHWLEIGFSSSSPEGLLEHPRISLDANSPYRFSLMIATDDTSIPSGLLADPLHGGIQQLGIRQSLEV